MYILVTSGAVIILALYYAYRYYIMNSSVLQAGENTDHAITNKPITVPIVTPPVQYVVSGVDNFQITAETGATQIASGKNKYLGTLVSGYPVSPLTPTIRFAYLGDNSRILQVNKSDVLIVSDKFGYGNFTGLRLGLL